MMSLFFISEVANDCNITVAKEMKRNDLW